MYLPISTSCAKGLFCEKADKSAVIIYCCRFCRHFFGRLDCHFCFLLFKKVTGFCNLLSNLYPMTYLSPNWITEGHIDFEYKKYQLLAYLQRSSRNFDQIKLYPILGELIAHHRRLHELKSGKSQLKDLFPKTLASLDWKAGKLSYEATVNDGEIMKELASIIEFALPRFGEKINDGKSIYDFVEEQMEFGPIGLLPMYKQEGYLLLSRDKDKNVLAYRYKSSLLHQAGEQFRSITLWFIGAFQRSLVLTLEKIKMELVKEFKDLPNPATWRVHSQQEFPIEETILPIGKRLLLKSVAA